MILVHATHRKNVPSIKRRGLLARYATQKRRAVWAVPGGNEEWAVNHVMRHKRCLATDVALILIEAKGLAFKRHGDGTLYLVGDVPPERIRKVRVLQWSVIA